MRLAMRQIEDNEKELPLYEAFAVLDKQCYTDLTRRKI